MRILRHPGLWLLLAAGVAIRLFFAWHWYGSGDLLTFNLLGARTDALHSHVYATNLEPNRVYWPYPPGYLLWLVAAYRLAGDLDVRFDQVAQLLPILADIAIAVCVYVYLGWHGRSERYRLAGVALVALGPEFIAISGYHGQLDAVATLPGVVGFMVWERARGLGRPIASGMLIGIGGVLKTVPLLLLVPLLSRARTVRDAVALWGAALAVVAAACLPFYLAERTGFNEGLRYTGVPGRGGISVVLDPAFAAARRLDPILATTGHPNGITDWISKANGPITLLIVAGLALFVLRYRPTPLEGTILLWLAIFAFSPNFLLQYLVWLLPFAVMAGYLWPAAIVQLVAIPPLIITYVSSTSLNQFWADFYVVWMAAMWVGWVVALFVLARSIMRRSTTPPSRQVVAEPAL